jgi:hypothetical protein
VGLGFHNLVITIFFFIQECAAVCEEKITQKISQLAEKLQKNEEKLSEAIFAIAVFTIFIEII